MRHQLLFNADRRLSTQWLAAWPTAFEVGQAPGAEAKHAFQMVMGMTKIDVATIEAVRGPMSAHQRLCTLFSAQLRHTLHA
ncbi:hypothetical protein [Azospirillum brasilense]|uniref:Uncharacterized protein n=1 Tax=Azospirillum brasilense TaxID=192 RepID=A0A235H4J0_AZOBR|nr:hypothetical protein [Azospirillum brasilense]OYD80443.1 hypothetical protein CHT98_31250 [Azospirillum brasilense]